MLKLYYNPHCSKSRQALALLQQAKLTPKLIDYQSHPPSIETLQNLIARSEHSLKDFIRTNDPDYNTYCPKNPSEYELLTLLHQHPKLLQRPILDTPTQVLIARAPEILIPILHTLTQNT